MKRLVLTDGTGRWFDADKADKFEEETWHNGNNWISYATGSQWEHECLYRTAGGLWIKRHWSQYQGSGEFVEEITKEEAAEWLSINRFDMDSIHEEVKKQFAELEMR